MKDGLKLGDLILDPRRVVYIPSLNAVVCAGLHEALSIGISGGLRGVLERMDAVLETYKPEALIILGLGDLSEKSPVTGIARRWGKQTKIHFVTNESQADGRMIAEALGCEVHHELVWGRYRFVESEKKGVLEVQLLTIVGHPNYVVKVGSMPFGGMKLAVFLKGIGKLILPTLSPNAASASVFNSDLGRYDLFAVGHQRVLPMGKVDGLKSVKGIGRGLPIVKATLGAKRRAPKEPLAD